MTGSRLCFRIISNPVNLANGNFRKTTITKLSTKIPNGSKSWMRPAWAAGARRCGLLCGGRPIHFVRKSACLLNRVLTSVGMANGYLFPATGFLIPAGPYPSLCNGTLCAATGARPFRIWKFPSGTPIGSSAKVMVPPRLSLPASIKFWMTR